ncbi:MAG: hypothetical protein R2854_30705 [Caldilineaceae bacterium]
MAARRRYPLVKYTDKISPIIAVDVELQGGRPPRRHRSSCAQAFEAAYEGRLQITDNDILLAAEPALPHRMKKQPFQSRCSNPDQPPVQHAPGTGRGRRSAGRRGTGSDGNPGRGHG